jgi:hypothetical protein
MLIDISANAETFRATTAKRINGTAELSSDTIPSGGFDKTTMGVHYLLIKIVCFIYILVKSQDLIVQDRLTKCFDQ